jgi:hypothetical protein
MWAAPGVEKIKLDVSRNVTTAPTLPTKDSFAETGRSAIKNASPSSMMPMDDLLHSSSFLFLDHAIASTLVFPAIDQGCGSFTSNLKTSARE